MPPNWDEFHRLRTCNRGRQAFREVPSRRSEERTGETLRRSMPPLAPWTRTSRPTGCCVDAHNRFVEALCRRSVHSGEGAASDAACRVLFDGVPRPQLESPLRTSVRRDMIVAPDGGSIFVVGHFKNVAGPDGVWHARIRSPASTRARVPSSHGWLAARVAPALRARSRYRG